VRGIEVKHEKHTTALLTGLFHEANTRVSPGTSPDSRAQQGRVWSALI